MSEVNLHALAESGKDHIESKAPTPMQEINEALKSCSFGLFHIRLLCTSFFGLVSGIAVTNTTPYILPNAECDLNMNLLQKGVLNAMPFIGMIISSVVAGFMTDTFGRKIFLVGGFGGISLFTMFSALSQTYEMLLTAKFFEGILFAAAFSPAVTFTTEFCHNGVRDRVVLLQSSFQSMGQIVIGLISWSVLTKEWRFTFFDGSLVLNTWNIYLFFISLGSLFACVLYCFLPESPKFLLTKHKYDEARDVLIAIYKQNTRKSADTFPYKDIWKIKTKQAIDEAPEKKIKTTFQHELLAGLHNIKPMFRKPLASILILFCSANFLVMVLYNVIRLWFPQLSTIVEHYSSDVDGNQDLCVMLDAYTDDLRTRSVNLTGSETCVPTKSGAETYINSIILGCVCVLGFMLTGVIVNVISKRYIEICFGVITIGLTLGLRWASSKTEVVALFATDMAVSQTMMSLLQAMTVEAFPTTTRTLAVSMMMTSGRIGTLVGNIAFPVLLNMGCQVPFFTLAVMMICVTIMTIFLPEKKNL